jgi:hypothetical protein
VHGVDACVTRQIVTDVATAMGEAYEPGRDERPEDPFE